MCTNVRDTSNTGNEGKLADCSGDAADGLVRFSDQIKNLLTFGVNFRPCQKIADKYLHLTHSAKDI